VFKKSIIIPILLISILFSLVITPSFAAISAGQTCKSLNKTSNVGKLKFRCVKKGKKLVWTRVSSENSMAPKENTNTSTTTNASTSTKVEPQVEQKKESVVPDPVLSDRTTFKSAADCKITSGNSNVDLYTGFPRSSKFIASTGDRKSVVLFVDFSDLPADPKAFAEWKNNQIPFAENAFSEMSYGKYRIKYEIVEKFFRLPIKWQEIVKNEAGNIPGSTPALAMNHQKLISETVKLADVDVNFALYDFINIVTPSTKPKVEGGASGGGGFTVDGRSSFLAISGPLDEYLDDRLKLNWLTHETGHLLGLTHIYNFQQRQGAWDLMGNVFAHHDILAWNKFFLSWIEDNQVDCLDNTISGETVHRLSPISDKKSDVKMVIVKLSSTECIILESRRKSNLDPLSSNEEGVLVYKVDTKIPDGQGTVTLLSNPIKFGRDRRGNEVVLGTLKQGESATFEGYSIKVVKQSELGDFVSLKKS
jgi:M6 family metalloprotease-like protein